MTDEIFDDKQVAADDDALTRISRPRGALSWDDEPETGPGETDAVLRVLRVLREDVGEGVDPAPVVRLSRRRLGARGVAAVAVAGVVVSMGGVAAASVGAAPGSLLYPIRQVVTGHRAPDAGLTALGRLLDDAQKSLDAGRLSSAHALLDAAQGRLDAIRPGDLTSAEKATFDDDQVRLAALEQQLAAALSEVSRSIPNAKSGSAPGRQTPKPGNDSHPTAPPVQPGHGNPATQPPGRSGDHPRGESSSAPPRERVLQPWVRGESSSAASSTPSANPLA
jgi:hypothetical protein